MERDIKDVTLAFKPGGQTAEFMMILKQQNLMTATGKPVGGGKATEAGTDDDNVVTICYFCKRKRHGGQCACGRRSALVGRWAGTLGLRQNMLVNHGNTAQHRADNTQETLVGAGEE